MKAVKSFESVTLSGRSVALLEFQLAKLDALEVEYLLIKDEPLAVEFVLIDGGPRVDRLQVALDRVDRMRGVVISDLRKFIEMDSSQ